MKTENEVKGMIEDFEIFILNNQKSLNELIDKGKMEGTYKLLTEIEIAYNRISVLKEILDYDNE